MAYSSAAAYLAVVASVVVGFMPVWTLLVLLTVPLAYLAIREASKFDDEKFYTPAMSKTIALSSIATLLLTVGYGIAALVK
jgi:1,4-dihydroxy-2-naphthoate octaprenyltransferase